MHVYLMVTSEHKCEESCPLRRAKRGGCSDAVNYWAEVGIWEHFGFPSCTWVWLPVCGISAQGAPSWCQQWCRAGRHLGAEEFGKAQVEVFSLVAASF